MDERLVELVLRAVDLIPRGRVAAYGDLGRIVGTEPYASVVREANDRWARSLVDHLVRSGVARPLAKRAATIIDAAFLGFQLDAPLVGPTARRRAVGDLADAVAALAG